MTRRAAGLAAGEWDDEARGLVAGLFDSLAQEWHTRSSPERSAVVADAIERSGIRGSRAIEVGSGTGAYTARLSERFGTVVALDLSLEMLRLAPMEAGPRLRADASSMPVADGTVDVVVLINAFLFPVEVDRVLASGGSVLWVNSSGVETPIHLTTAEVAAALPGEWTGVEATAGIGTWCALHRA